MTDRGKSGEPGDPPAAAPRSWAAISWRQLPNPPSPIVTALSPTQSVAIVLAVAYVAYDVAISRGAAFPGGDLRTLAIAGYVVVVLVSGSLVTWFVVPQPTGSGSTVRRTAWSAAIGFFAAVPIAYLVIVVAVQLVRPFLG